MKKKVQKKKVSKKSFDDRFDSGEVEIDFSKATTTEGLSSTVKLPPMTIPAWLNSEIEAISRLQANSKSSVIRQLLVEALKSKAEDKESA